MHRFQFIERFRSHQAIMFVVPASKNAIWASCCMICGRCIQGQFPFRFQSMKHTYFNGIAAAFCCWSCCVSRIAGCRFGSRATRAMESVNCFRGCSLRLLLCSSLCAVVGCTLGKSDEPGRNGSPSSVNAGDSSAEPVNPQWSEKHVGRNDSGQIVSLTLEGSQFGDASLHGVERLVHLESLNLTNSSVTGHGLKPVIECKALKNLELTNSKAVGDSGASILAAHPSLQRLSVANCAITDEGLASLTKLKTLTHLIASANRITDKGVAAIGSLENIEHLNFYGCKIEGRSFDQLSRLPNLKWVNLTENPLCEESVPYLIRLSKLEYLNVRRTPLSAANVEALRLALPKAEVK